MHELDSERQLSYSKLAGITVEHPVTSTICTGTTGTYTRTAQPRTDASLFEQQSSYLLPENEIDPLALLQAGVPSNMKEKSDPPFSTGS